MPTDEDSDASAGQLKKKRKKVARPAMMDTAALQLSEDIPSEWLMAIGHVINSLFDCIVWRYAVAHERPLRSRRRYAHPHQRQLPRLPTKQGNNLFDSINLTSSKSILN